MDRNYSGPCGQCCECPFPQFAYVNRSASKSKLGFTEFVDPSTPPKYYLTQTWSSSGGGACNGYSNCNGTVSTAGSASYDRLTGACTGSDSRNGGEVVSSCGQTYFFAVCWSLGGDCNEADSGIGPNQVVDSGPQYTQTTYSETWTCTGCSASASIALSAEYTTAELIADALSLLPTTWPALSAFNPSLPGEIASTELASNETSYSVMDGKYQFAHQVPPGATYKLAWVERFTPDGGGAPTDTPQTYQWTGSTPPGYDPNNAATWPKTSIFEVDHPASNGSISIVNLTVDCGAGPVSA